MKPISPDIQLKSRLDILEEEFREGKIKEDNYRDIKSKILSEMGLWGKFKSYWVKNGKYPAMIFH